jgi:hypothetical protein
MSRKSKSKDQTKTLNIPFTLTQGDLVQEALAVTFAKDQIQALNIPVKVPLWKIVYRWSRLVVSFCILLSDWFFFLASDWLMDTGFCHLIGKKSAF